MPEIVIVLRCSEASTFERTIFVDEIKAEYEKIMEQRKADIKLKREEARNAAQEEKLEELKGNAEEETTED